MPVNHRDFWYATYTLYSVSELVDNEEKVNDAASGSSGGDQASSNRQLTMVSFLKPVLKQIIMAGKSMQLLRNLDCKEAQQSESSSRGERWTHGASSLSLRQLAGFHLSCRRRQEELIHAVPGVGAVAALQPRRISSRCSE